jgi:hypothetical protein
MQKLNEVRHRWVRVTGMAGLAAVLFVPLGPTAVKADTKTTSTPSSNGQPKLTVCHKGVTTIVISQASYQNHLSHGDTPGPCNVTTVN